MTFIPVTHLFQCTFLLFFVGVLAEWIPLSALFLTRVRGSKNKCSGYFLQQLFQWIWITFPVDFLTNLIFYINNLRLSGKYSRCWGSRSVLRWGRQQQVGTCLLKSYQSIRHYSSLSTMLSHCTWNSYRS